MHRLLVLLPLVWTGCATVQTGHRGLLFTPGQGLHRQILAEGRHWVGVFGHVEDFDVTYSTKTEEIHTTSTEGLPLQLRIAVSFRPVVSELYQLATEEGLNYYDEVVGPEFRSAARGVFAGHSYLELLRRNEQIEDEIESHLRRRTAGKHIEIRSVTLESILYAPAIGRAVQERLAAEQDAARQKTLLANEAMQNQMRADAALKQKQREAELARAQAEVDRIREESEAARRVVRAKAEAEAAKHSAQARAEQARLANRALTPLAVMAMGFDALKALGGSNAHILIGDWSRVPSFLFPSLAPFHAAAKAAPAP
ncbi:MAG TPA: prohibitin family protein [Polyangia bacterium]|jgi:regulator of protease activity HflC (stomatin/prohibitin superfamily)